MKRSFAKGIETTSFFIFQKKDIVNSPTRPKEGFAQNSIIKN